MCHVYEPWRSFLAALFALGRGASDRTKFLAWDACPADVKDDLIVWRALLNRDLFANFFLPVQMQLDTTLTTVAYAGLAHGPGCVWASGCGVGGSGPGGGWFSEEVDETICPMGGRTP